MLAEGVRAETIVATQDTALLTLRRADFVSVVGALSSDAVRQAASNIPVPKAEKPKPKVRRLTMHTYTSCRLELNVVSVPLTNTI